LDNSFLNSNGSVISASLGANASDLGKSVSAVSLGHLIFAASSASRASSSALAIAFSSFLVSFFAFFGVPLGVAVAATEAAFRFLGAGSGDGVGVGGST